MLWSFLDVHASQTNSNGARGDNDDSVTIFAQLHGCVDDESQNRQQGLVSLLIDDGAGSCSPGVSVRAIGNREAAVRQETQARSRHTQLDDNRQGLIPLHICNTAGFRDQ